jgi:glyoxylase-like metal-dependent hydrolase (beta-lactamase superfamily II)
MEYSLVASEWGRGLLMMPFCSRVPLIALFAGAAICAAGPASEAQTSPRLAGYVHVAERVAPGVHVLRQKETHFSGVVGNVTVIEQSDGLVLIDTGASHGSGKRVVDLVKRISPKTVKSVILTHWHNDHPLGLSAIVKEWPGAEIIATEATKAFMEEGRLGKIPRAPDSTYEERRRQLLEDALSSARDSAADPKLSQAERDGWAASVVSGPIRLADAAGTHVILPNKTFKERLAIPDAIAPVEILFMGSANTAGDAEVWLPKQRVLVAGDTVVEPVPYMFNVFPTDMLAVFAKMRAFDYAVLVPGHGAPQLNREYLDRLTDFVREVQRQVSPLVRQGLTLDEVKTRTDFAAQKRAFAGEDPWIGFWFDQYALEPLMDSVYREAKGERLGPPPIQP